MTEVETLLAAVPPELHAPLTNEIRKLILCATPGSGHACAIIHSERVTHDTAEITMSGMNLAPEELREMLLEAAAHATTAEVIEESGGAPARSLQ
jgi:hypothetical protein